MSLGSDTGVVNGQRFSFPTSASFNPASYGPQTTGVPNVSPSMPPFIGSANTAGGSGGAYGQEGVGGYGTAGNNALVAGTANANPHNWKVSPVWWAIVLLLGGLVALKGIHWRDTILESGSEHGRLGAAEEHAEEHV